MTNPVKAWSFSRWETYEQCPLRFKLKYIDKLKEPPSPALDKGKRVHDEAECFLTTPDAPLPDSLRRFEGLFFELRELPGMIADQETLQWGYDAQWRPAGWFAKATWFRSVLDAFVPYSDDTATGIDFKTGKMREISYEQIETQALAAFSRIPSLRVVEMRLWYLDSGSEIIQTYSADNVPALKEKWEKNAAPMFSDTLFAPRPNRMCRFCAFRRSEGGQCRYG